MLRTAEACRAGVRQGRAGQRAGRAGASADVCDDAVIQQEVVVEGPSNAVFEHASSRDISQEEGLLLQYALQIVSPDYTLVAMDGSFDVGQLLDQDDPNLDQRALVVIVNNVPQARGFGHGFYPFPRDPLPAFFHDQHVLELTSHFLRRG